MIDLISQLSPRVKKRATKQQPSKQTQQQQQLNSQRTMASTLFMALNELQVHEIFIIILDYF